MRAHWLQHVPYEGLGQLEPLLAARKADVTCTRLFAGERLPRPQDPDLLVILGGPMSVNDEQALPWLAAEKAFIREVIARDAAVLGICLGAQLIASALGAPVGPNREAEIGWWPVRRVTPPDLPSTERFAFPDELTCLNWHSETFGLPGGAVHLARSAACEHQAMQIGRRVIGLQFHPEANRGWIEAVLARSGASLPSGPYVMNPNELTIQADERCPFGQVLLEQLIDFLMSD